MMSRANGGVVNERMVVWGTKNLRVCDASIIPMVPRGNIMASVYAWAERGADIIKQDLDLSMHQAH
jgi:choline dehydrogenase-like flavoprotein